MIEINLLPGSAKRSPRRGLPKFGGGGGGGGLGGKLKLPPVDRMIAGIAAAWIIGLGAIAYLYLSNKSRMDELVVAEQAAVRDSARFATIKARGDSLLAQEAIISQKLQVIQEIDGARFIWPHIMDEVSRALPQYVWLVNMNESFSEGGVPRIRLEGRAGNYFALSRYQADLERSPFLSGVRLVSSSRTTVDERLVLQFILEFSYEQPPPDVIQTVPLFAATAEGED